jgi:pSer/pThr/pTyr-binding forkhead associated (FHA) protein
METSVDLMVMSGVEDGRMISLSSANGEGKQEDGAWVIRMGRREDNDIWLRYDSFASRYHARLHCRETGWWLEDCNSKNHTYIETDEDDAMVSGTIPLQVGQLFRIGRTWFRIQV